MTIESVLHSASIAVRSEPNVFESVADFFSLHHIGNVNEKFIQNFKFVPYETPLSSPLGVGLVVAAYFCTIHLLRAWVRARGRPFDLNWFVIFHNSLMSIGSAVLWLAMVSELVMIWSKFGIWSLACDPEGKHTRGPIVFIYFINYIFKYIELVDTFLLALRGKDIPFLHSYHHAATLVLCWSQLWAQSCIQWLPIVINLLVHVIMYGYYTLHALRLNIWWKKYLTTLQIVQFVVALTGCVAAFATRTAALRLHILPAAQYGCVGSDLGAVVGVVIIASYLYLFIILFQAKYTKPTSAKAAPQQQSQQQQQSNGRPRTLGEAVSNGYHKSAKAFDLATGSTYGGNKQL